ncbi:unnamed protein product [Durusdinium trenchii]|uniref:WWE domain-containing protein n=1 Tax=Durusdinium trenchii TaxID=1381693 RepID=A0ABP0JMU9_9DINO
MADCQTLTLLVVLCSASASMFVMAPVGAQALAALNPMLGIVVPIGCLLCSAGCLAASIFVKPKERSSEDYYEDESARRSPVRAEADSDEAAPQVVGADFLGEVWQVKAGPAGGWIDFDAQISLEISDAIARGEESFRVTVRGTNYEINVVEYYQRNISTGRKRDIRQKPQLV